MELEAALQQEQAKTASLEEQLKGRAGGGGKRPKKKGGGPRALPTLSRCGGAVGCTADCGGCACQGVCSAAGLAVAARSGLSVCVSPEAFWQRSGLSVGWVGRACNNGSIERPQTFGRRESVERRERSRAER